MRRIMIEKEDNTQKVFLSENTLDVEDILQKNYDYIYKSMGKEGFILKYSECNLFKELVFDGKVVGFCTYDYSREFLTAAINNIYVMPEYRGNRFLLNELKKTMEEHNKPSIMEPTRLVVELLIRYGFAAKVSDRLAASAIEFIVPGNHVLSNTDYGSDELSTHFYDLEICASIHILDLNKSHIAYSLPLNYDIIHYDCIDSRNNIDENYFAQITDYFRENDVLLMNTIVDLEENLPIKTFTIDEVIGDDGEFSFYIESLIDDAHITHSKALEIKNQIKEEYEAGMILNESLLIRLAYLFNENPKVTITSHDEVCPYCSMPIDSHDRFCHYCGINLDYDVCEMQDNLLKSITINKSNFKEDIRFTAYKFLRLIDERIDVEYSIFTVENNYNITWNHLDNFLKTNNYFENDQITPEGYEFMNSHPLHFWEKYNMDIVDYTDFENYFYSNNGSDFKDVCLNYLKQFDDDEYIVELINEINSDCS